MTDTELNLRRAICADPADDLPRLALADYWDENGRPDRAALVRVQIELSKLGPPRQRFGFGDPSNGEVMRPAGPDYWQFTSPEHVLVGARIDVKRHRLKWNQKDLHRKEDKVFYGLLVTKIEGPHEAGYTLTVKRDADSVPWVGQELLDRQFKLYHSPDIRQEATDFALVLGLDGVFGGDHGYKGGTGVQWEWSRGFIGSVRMSLGKFYSEYGPDIVSVQPITSIQLLDRRPSQVRHRTGMQGGTRWAWFNENNGISPDQSVSE